MSIRRDVADRGVAGGRRGSPAGLLPSLVCFATALTGVAALGLVITTPPRSGPFCQASCVTYPYTDVAEFVPRDYLWMYPAILLAVMFVAMTACIHDVTPVERRAGSLTGVSLAAVAAGALIVDYGLQLSVVQPSLLAGEGGALSVLSQYNPHGVFIGLENVGYAVTAVAFILCGAALTDPDRRMRAVRLLLIGGGAVLLVALVLLSVWYAEELDYRFEVTAILVVWVVQILSGLVLGLRFRPTRPRH